MTPNAEDASVRLAELAKDIEYIRAGVDELKAQMLARYVTKEEFEPVKKIVYALAGVILMAVVAALVGSVVTGGGPPS